ncbi:hypothetical protein MADE_1014720 [Alteromonas mediterranea DE]|uniref:Uncharacterized protein n=1 Tax=Alteromonas mediterranea (strain DSM 17117 / CIP 110805 / LMG 28347 / Deep ecotype) TaxID=1774373 RepID=F2GCC2_ALTMD|nr:hypothetical protein MADE_1014720 [Alteromonas mediterranea DE]
MRLLIRYSRTHGMATLTTGPVHMMANNPELFSLVGRLAGGIFAASIVPFGAVIYIEKKYDWNV